ncbi:hypothetical protein [Streptomyces sclerotialus]|uniref:hypothetical protein n=1 Tax=Streptomyces sclerotialus TaxID=1957 RepID=UPI0004CAAD59
MRNRKKAMTAVGAAMTAAALLGMTGPASAAPAAAPAPAGAAVQKTKCGVHTGGSAGLYYKNCSKKYGHKVKVDHIMAPDLTHCVKPGKDEFLGTVSPFPTKVRGAKYIGHCKP